MQEKMKTSLELLCDEHRDQITQLTTLSLSADLETIKTVDEFGKQKLETGENNPLLEEKMLAIAAEKVRFEKMKKNATRQFVEAVFNLLDNEQHS